MDKGKFSQPRPYRDEERQIEEAFRQVTGQGQKPQAYQPKYAAEPAVPEETVILPEGLSAEQIPVSNPEPEAEPEIPEFIPEPEPYFPENTESFFPQEPVEIPSATKRSAVKDFLFPVEEPEFPEESDYEEEPAPESFLDTVMVFCSNNRKWVLTGLCAFALVLIVSVICVFAFGGDSSTGSETIRSDIFVADINIRGRTRKQAISAVEQSADFAYPGNDMVIDLAGNKLTLSQKDTGVKLDVEAAVDAAFQLDQTASGTTRYVALLPYLDLNTDYILQELHTYATDTGSTLTQTSYGLEGSYPKLSVEKFREDSAQTLVVTMGTPGISFDVDTVYDQILDAYSMFQFSVTVSDVETTVEPDPLDLQAVYEEFYVEPVDSTVNMQTFEVIPGSYGYEFDLLAAQKLLDKAQYGEIIRIPMTFIEPVQLEEDTLFRDVLGEFQTSLTSEKNRTTNIRLACEALNGTVLEPGETFSFNETVGKPSSDNGYKTVVMQIGSEEEEVRGGGISQAASTLYHCVLLADLEVTSRTNHTYVVDFVDYGLDADVKYGSIDFKFRNNQNYPIKLEAEVSGNEVCVRILGTDERDYYVRMESSITATHKPATKFEDFEYDNAEGYLDGDIIQKGSNGYTVKTYKLKYDRQSGSMKSRDYETSSRYAAIDRIVASVAEPETTVPETTVPPTTVPPTTVPPETTVPPTTEAPPETTVPPTTEAPSETTAPPATEAPAVETQPQETEVFTPVLEDTPAEEQNLPDVSENTEATEIAE